MKLQKGNYGYIKARKNTLLVKALIFYFLVLGFFIAGLMIYETKANNLTIIAALLVLPAAQYTVGYSVLIPYSTESDDRYNDITNYLSKSFLLLCDLVVSSTNMIINLPFVIIVEGNVYAYIKSKKYEDSTVKSYLEQLMQNIGVKAKIYVYKDYDEFITKIKKLKQLDVKDNSNNENIKNELLRNCM